MGYVLIVCGIVLLILFPCFKMASIESRREEKDNDKDVTA